MSWRNLSGPLFGNTIATLETAGRTTRVIFEQPLENSELIAVTEISLMD